MKNFQVTACGCVRSAKNNLFLKQKCIDETSMVNQNFGLNAI